MVLNPSYGRKKCENYFEMCDTEYYMWVKVSSMHFVGRAERWLQLVTTVMGGILWFDSRALRP
jgi:hypothetical protein